MKNAQVVDVIAVIILIIGGLNWGLVGFFEWNFIGSVFGYTSVLARTIYSLVGVAAVFKIIYFTRKTKG